MALKERLDCLSAVPAGVVVRYPRETEVGRAVRRLGDAVDEAGSTTSENPAAFIARIRKHWESHHRLEGLHSRDLRGIAANLFTPDDSGSRLVDERGFLRAFLAKFESLSSSQTARNLCFSFFRGYEPRSSAIKAIERALHAVPPERHLPFLASAIELDIIDAKFGSQHLAEWLAKSKESLRESLHILRIRGGLEQSNLVEYAFTAFCKIVEESAAKRPILFERLLDWACPEGQSGDTINATFPKRLSETARALLLPWAGGVDPEMSLEQNIRNFLIGALGDPRFTTASMRWSKVDEDAQRVLTRWLNRASLDQFFNIVTKTMTEPDEKRMWRYRRKFWTAFLPHMNDAWVVFGREGARLARQVATSSNDKNFGDFEKISGGSVLPTHAVLIMTIGDLVIAEWNHNGYCRIWQQNMKKAPIPYQNLYSPHQLRSDSLWRTSHHGNEAYKWQYKVSDKIHQYTGIKVFKQEYEVR